MRIITLSLIMTCVACAQAPVMKPKAAQPAQTVPTPASVESTQDATTAQNAADEQIQADDVAAVMTASTGTPVEMDMVSMEQQVQAAFAQSNLSPQQSAAMSEKSMALIAAANAGDQAAVTKLSNELVKQAVGGKGLIPSFGLVDVAGIVAAIMDLIAAAANADVAGIVDALMDLVAALA
ncbi:MAG TPA: hypothetical protein VFO10_25940 [Oligoflexus sp.]|uniref:hypothetical protein n=1 Tax=Oligoflexus sp. TaxID=1971216 RepID=UPI002D7E3FB4|nr:hypothetical protein [Oligoflexus sp.]HET9240732.1 hypothetical protein [Oligoflexus sp.]